MKPQVTAPNPDHRAGAIYWGSQGLVQLRLLEIHWTEARQAKVEALFEIAARHALAYLGRNNGVED